MYIGKEYKGEKILGKLTARLVPPNNQYPDCMCELLITEQHLYVLEDNFNDTYDMHFCFSLTQIESLDTVEIESKGSQKKQMSTIEYLLTAFLGAIGGMVITPRQNKKSADLIFFAVTYKNGMGDHEKLYFKELQMSSKNFKKTFQDAYAAIYAG